ncbi:MAG: MATE family efflux transporter [Ruminococcaceae bacterium]|nr:MATE family efflux transporter [Oscillospiraceae bacterium]
MNTDNNAVTRDDKPLLLQITKFILPLMLTGILQLLYNAADSIVVGRWDGPNALAAVTSVGSLVNLLLNVFMGFSVGTAVTVAHDYGAKDEAGVQRTIHTSITLSLVSGIVVGIIGFIFSGTFLEWMDSPENVIDSSKLYLMIYFLGTPANMVYNFGASILRSIGETKKPLYFLTAAGILNVILNLLLVIGFGLGERGYGVVGVGVGTIVSQYVSAICVIVYMIKRKDSAHLDIRKLKFHPDKLRKIITVGLPAGLQGIAFSLSNVLIQSSINSFGEFAVAGNGAAANVEGFTYIAMNALYHATLTFVGQNVGARKYHKINKVVVTCMILVIVVGVVLGSLTYIFGEQLLSLYLNKNDEGFDLAIAYGQERMLYISLTYFLCGAMEVMVGAQRGLGMSLIPMVNALVGTCVLRIAWIKVVFAALLTLSSVYISYPISWVFTTTAHCIFYAVRLHKLKKQNALQPA